MKQEQLQDSDRELDTDLERRIGESMQLEEDFGFPEEILHQGKKNISNKNSTETIERSLKDNLGNIVKRIASSSQVLLRTLKQPVIFLLGGMLPYKYQMAIQDKYGQEYFNARNATAFSALFSTHALYYSLAIFTSYRLGLSGMQAVSTGMMAGLSAWAISGGLRVVRIETRKNKVKIVGEPVLSLLTLGYDVVRNVSQRVWKYWHQKKENTGLDLRGNQTEEIGIIDMSKNWENKYRHRRENRGGTVGGTDGWSLSYSSD